MREATIQKLLAVLCCAAVLLAGNVMALAQMEPAQPPVTLKVGDSAPPLATGKWVKGEPITKLEEGKIYIMEFWATWCGPCITAIPHVTEMQHTYGKDGVIVIGQNVWENDTSAVEPFVKNMGAKMDYRVVMDDTSGGGRGKMAETWMEAAGQNGIPCSFIVGRDSKIAWIGHPMQMEPVLKQVIAGTFDAVAHAAKQAEAEKVGMELSRALQARDMDKALKLADDFEAANPEMKGPINALRFQLYIEKKDYDNAYKAAAVAGEAANNDAGTLNQIAWFIVDQPGLEKRDLALAEKLAKRAVELTENKEASIIDTLARVHFEKGELDKAIELQTDAVAKESNAQQKAELQSTLDRYRKAKADKATQ